MKTKRIMIGIVAIGFIFSMSGCTLLNINNTPSQTANTIEQDKTVYEIQNAVTDVKKMVESACIGVYTTLTTTSYATGSGVVYKEENGYYYAITNHHVIEDGKSYKVYLGGTKYYTATVLGADSTNDIAVLKFSTDLLGSNTITPIDITQEDVITPGQTAIAIGCPLSLSYYNHITVGVVTGVTEKYVQTDAALNSGNSGGGLFNISGRLIGINVSKTSWTSETDKDVVVEGFGNAIPMDIVRKCVSDIEEKQTTISRPLLGVTGGTVNRYTSSEEHVRFLPDTIEQAFIITKIVDGGNAAKAGFMPFDVIYKVNDTDIISLENLSHFLNTSNIGDVATFNVYRLDENNKFISIALTVTFE